MADLESRLEALEQDLAATREEVDVLEEAHLEHQEEFAQVAAVVEEVDGLEVAVEGLGRELESMPEQTLRELAEILRDATR